MSELTSLVYTYNTLAIAISVFLILLSLAYALGENRIVPALLLIAVLAVPIIYALDMLRII